jgi:hypothetical protein
MDPPPSDRLQLEINLLDSRAASDDAPQMRGQGHTILVVVREADLRAYITLSLTSIATFRVVESGMVTPWSDDADLLVVDASMMAHRDALTARTPVLFIADEPPERSPVLEGKKFDVLIQPFNAHRLIQSVTALLT